MTDDRTPLQRLDDAVHDYFAAQQLDDGSTVAGWVLAYQRTAFDPTAEQRGYQPVKWGHGYAIAAGLSETAAIGLIDVLHEHLRLAAVMELRDQEPDEDEP